MNLMNRSTPCGGGAEIAKPRIGKSGSGGVAVSFSFWADRGINPKQNRTSNRLVRIFIAKDTTILFLTANLTLLFGLAMRTKETLSS